MKLQELFSKKLIVVTGKGGVGKTAVSLALSHLNAGHGRRPVFVTLTEVKKGSYFFGYNAGIDDEERLLDKNITAVSVNPNTALREYIRENFVKLYPVYATILKSKTLQTFFEAAPGLKELITIGKVWHLGTEDGGQRYDQVIFDAPSTGHAIPILNLPSKVLDMMRGGASREHIEWVEGFLKDPLKTAVVVVAMPEEMVVKETLELIESVKSLGINILFTVVNNVYEKIFDRKEEKILSGIGGNDVAPDMSPVIELAMEQIDRARISEKYVRRLRSDFGDRVLTVQKIFKKDLSPEDLQLISRELENQLNNVT